MHGQDQAKGVFTTSVYRATIDAFLDLAESGDYFKWTIWSSSDFFVSDYAHVALTLRKKLWLMLREIINAFLPQQKLILSCLSKNLNQFAFPRILFKQNLVSCICFASWSLYFLSFLCVLFVFWTRGVLSVYCMCVYCNKTSVCSCLLSSRPLGLLRWVSFLSANSACFFHYIGFGVEGYFRANLSDPMKKGISK